MLKVVTVRGVRPVNEDSYRILSGFLADGYTPFQLMVIADGMGGYDQGQDASRIVCKKVIETLSKQEDVVPVSDYLDKIERSLREVNQQLLHYGVSYDKRLGSTVALVLRIGSDVGILNAGDTRIYGLYNGEVGRLSVDHSQIEQDYRDGLLAELPSDGADGRNILTSGIGVLLDFEVYKNVVPIDGLDFVVICTDGLWGNLSDSSYASLYQTEHLEDLLLKWVDEALDDGSTDNITVGALSFL